MSIEARIAELEEQVRWLEEQVRWYKFMAQANGERANGAMYRFFVLRQFVGDKLTGEAFNDIDFNSDEMLGRVETDAGF